LPASLLAATLAGEVVAVALSWGLEPAWDTGVYFVYTVVLAGAGALIASRHPRNPIGWLFCATALFNGFAADLGQGWGLRAADAGWPGGTVAEWIALVSWIPSAPAIVLTFLLFPSGRLLSSRWRAAVWANLLGVVLVVPGWGLDPDIGDQFVGGRNPYAVAGLPTEALLAVGMPLLLGSLAVSVVPLALRLRRSAGVERKQVEWFAFAGVCAVVVLCLAVAFWSTFPIVRPLASLALTALPVAACIAILRYRLYDIDVVVSRTVAYGLLTVVLASAYAASALVLGTGVGRGSAWATAGATLVVAVAFRPVRDRVQGAVDRRFSRARYDALRRVEAFLDDLRAGRAAPEQVQDVLREAVDDPGLELRFLLPDSGTYVGMDGRPVADAPGEGRWPIRQGGTTLGEVVPGAATAPERLRSLLPQVMDAGRLAIEIARLRVELRRQLDEVAASRARIVAVADEERRRIERDLHDGAQQRLVSIGLAMRHAQHALSSGAEPEACRTLDGAVAEIAVAIDELRELARGLRPAHLDAGRWPAGPRPRCASRSARRATASRPTSRRPPTSRPARA
jgi:signal transduction histidine kinase